MDHLVTIRRQGIGLLADNNSRRSLVVHPACFPMGHDIRVPLSQGRVIQQVLNTLSNLNLTELHLVDPATVDSKIMPLRLGHTISHDLLNSRRRAKQILMRLMLPMSAQIGQCLKQMFRSIRISLRTRNNRNPI